MSKTKSNKKGKTTLSNNDTNVDLREALFNEGKKGPIQAVQVSTECITRLNGIMFDLDPPLYRRSSLIPEVPQDVTEFYEEVVRHWLDRHPVFAKAEVRATGSGLHVLLWFDSPVQLRSESEQQQWANVVQVVQCALPIDPRQPGITATTRVIGSINGKVDRQVTRLKAGTPVTQAEVEELRDQMLATPFKTVFGLVYGDTKISPCPFCAQPDSKFEALAYQGKCYGCGQTNLEGLYAILLVERKEVQPDLGRAA